MTFKEGDRVRRSDADSSPIPSYRDMRGTVEGLDGTWVKVLWDCDLHCSKSIRTSRHRPEDLALEDA